MPHPTARTTAKPPFSIPSPGAEARPGETVPRRHPAAADGLVTTPAEGVTTTYELVRASVAKFGAARCVGSRKLLRTHRESRIVRRLVNGEPREVPKEWTYFELGPYQYLSFDEYGELVREVGSGLRALGLRRADRVHLYAATSAQWLALSHGAASQSMPVVTAYDSLGEEAVRHSMLATGSRLVFLDPSLLPTMLDVLRRVEKVGFVVWNSHFDADPEHLARLRESHPGVRLLSFDELRALGREQPADPDPPAADDLCCIMYTSGSMGTPKGVMLKHRNVVAAVAGVNTVVGPVIGPGDGLLAYLPSAHILEFVFENAAIWWGATLGYGSPKTLSDGSVRDCCGDIREFRPSILVGVPAVFESVKKGIMAKLDAGKPAVKTVFELAMRAKATMLDRGIPGAAVLDAVVFRKLRDATGGRLKLCMNGGGPIAAETRRFISLALAPMIIGYGLTETTAMGCLMNPAEWNTHTMGAMPSCAEIKLVDFPDAGYHVTNQPHPQGEVLIRGGGVTDGYFQNDAETAEALTTDGWFRTGDIGEFDDHGHLRLIDRKKNLVKTLNGEYIALEKLESVYRATPVVANICVYAAASRTKPVAIVVPAEPALKELAAGVGAEGDAGELVHDGRVVGAVLAAMQAKGCELGLTGIEIIEGVVLTDEEWTPQNNMVTAAQKLNRRNILDKFRTEVDKAYGNAE